MTDEALYQLKFPVGEFQKPMVITDDHLLKWIQTIASFPKQIQEVTQLLSREQKNWKYRPNGWTIKQVVHHCADSHMNSIIRFKLALTEKEPTIRPYFEDRWANLTDADDDNLDDSIKLLEGLHNKWVKLLNGLTPEDLECVFIHPDSMEKITLKENIGIYAWHCEHHFEHIKQALASKDRYN